MTNEEWRQIPDFPAYSISSHGRVRRDTGGRGCCTAGRILKPESSTKFGHQRVRLARDGKIVAVLVHRLVAIAFCLPKRDDQTMVAHNDGDATNNHISNLRWATAKENLADRHRHGTAPCGERNYRTKISGMTEDKVREIRARLDQGDTQERIAADYSISQSSVSHIKCGRNWKYVA